MEEFSLDMVIYLLGLAFTWGSMMGRLTALERKMDKHNNLVEKVTTSCVRLDDMDEKIRAVHHRIDELREEVK